MIPEEKQRFFDLARRAHAGKASSSEQQELSGMLQKDAALQAEYERLGKDVNIAKEILPLLKASEAPPQRVPQYALPRLRTKVRETLARRKSAAGERKALVDVILAWAKGAETGEARQRRLELISELPERLLGPSEPEAVLEEPQMLYMRAMRAPQGELPDVDHEVRLLIDQLRDLQAEMKTTRDAFTKEILGMAEQMRRGQQEIEEHLKSLDRRSSQIEEQLLKLIQALRG